MSMIRLRPAELDADLIQVRLLGELLINLANADLYMVIEDPITGKKEPRLVGGQGKHDLLNHLKRHHIIEKVAPEKFDAGSTWYRTDMVYTEPAGGAKDAFITIRTNNGATGEWTGIFPMTKAGNVILGKDSNNKIISLASLVKEKRMKVTPTIDVQDAEVGELYIKDDNTIYLRKNGDPSSDRLLAQANTFTRELLVESIKVANKAPVNFNKNSLWLSFEPTEDADMSLATTAYLKTTDGESIFGLKFTTDRNNRTQSGAVISNNGKTLTVDNNVSQDFGFTWLNYPITRGSHVYLELDIQDPENKLSILGLANNVTQEQGFDYGNTDTIVKVNSTESKVNGTATPLAFNFHNRTVYIAISAPTVGVIRFYAGIVNDDGTSTPVYGNSNGLNFDNFERLAIAVNNSNTPNTKTVVNIRTFKAVNIPTGYIGINNALPTEKVFDNRAIATNAQSVFISKTKKLDSYVMNGRLVLGLKDYSNGRGAADAGLGELLLDYENKVLYAKMLDGSIANLKSKYEEIYFNHVNNSLTMTTKPSRELKVVENDRTIAYVSTFNLDPYDMNESVIGNFTMVDTLNGGTRYKHILPRTRSNLIQHQWVSILDENNYTGDLKTYLDQLADIVKNFRRSKNVYSSYIELMTAGELNSSFFKTSLFFGELLEGRRMINDSILLQTVGTDNNVLIDKIFKAPESGLVQFHKSTNRKGTLILFGESGKIYYNRIKQGFELDTWAENVYSRDDVTNIPGHLLAVKNITGKTLIGEKGSIEKELKFTHGNGFNMVYENVNNVATANNNMNLISVTGSNVNNNLTTKIGDTASNKTEIHSSTRPKLIGDNTPTINNGNEFVLKDDLKYSYGWKGKLNNGNNFIDLNTLKTLNHIGIWTADRVLTSATNGYPVFPTGVEFTGGVLDIKLAHQSDGLYLIQTLTPTTIVNRNQIEHHTVYTRTLDVKKDVWTDWSTSISKAEFDKKFDKAGGKISGSVQVQNELSVGGQVALDDGRLYLGSDNFNIYSIKRDPATSDKIISQISYSSTDKKFKLGSLENNSLSTYSINRPSAVVKNKLFGELTSLSSYEYSYAFLNDVNLVSEDLRNNYYNRTALDEALKLKANDKYVKDEIKKLLPLAGGTMTGNIVMSPSTNITFKDEGVLEFSKDAKFKLPTKKFASLDAVDTYSYNGLTRYDLVNINNVNNGLFTIGANMTLGATDISNIQFFQKADGDLQVRYLIGGTTKSEFRSVLFKDRVVNSNQFFKGTNSIVTDRDTIPNTEIAGVLYNSLISEYRGNISSYITDSAYNLNNLLKLQPGNYYVDNTDGLNKLNLDSSLVSVPGILSVQSDYDNTTNSIKILRYLPVSNKAEKENVVAEFIVANGLNAKWVYLQDMRYYYNKIQVDTKVTEVKNEVLSKVVVPTYKITGNPQQTAIPRVLVHTHNHTSDDTDKLYFKTNLNLNTITGSMFRYKIELDGETYTGGSIDITIVGEIIPGGDSAQKEAIVYNRAVGSNVEVEVFIKNGDVWFGIEAKPDNNRMSFDTYIRLSNIPNSQVGVFKPTVVEYTKVRP